MKLKEIAELAGVSPATVSLVLNNRSGVSDSGQDGKGLSLQHS